MSKCKIPLKQFKEQNKFTDIDFRNCTYFTNKEYPDKEFYNCNFKGVNLYKTKMVNVLFMNSQLDGAKFGSANLENAYINNCIFTGADLSNTNLTTAEIHSSDFSGANLTSAKMITTGKEAMISETNFTNAILMNIDLTGAKMTEVNLTGANLTGANLTNMEIMTNPMTDGSKFSNANLTGANLTNVDFMSSVFTNANFTNANLMNANFTTAILTGAVLTGANVSEAIGILNSTESPIESPINISPINKQIPPNQTGIDQIEGDVEMNEYLKENTNSIALLFGENYYLIDKSRLSNMIKKSSADEKMENSIVYECKVAGTMRRENIVLEKPLMKLGPIGLMNYSYIPVKYIKKVIENTDKIYEIVKTGTIESAVSYQYLHGLTESVSASHCQAGQNGIVYKLRKIVPETTTTTTTRKRKQVSTIKVATPTKTKTKTKKRKFGMY